MQKLNPLFQSCVKLKACGPETVLIEVASGLQDKVIHVLDLGNLTESVAVLKITFSAEFSLHSTSVEAK